MVITLAALLRLLTLVALPRFFLLPLNLHLVLVGFVVDRKLFVGELDIHAALCGDFNSPLFEFL